MSPRVLRRCSICGKFHAAYLVDEQGEKRYLCYSCWMARQAGLADAKEPAAEKGDQGSPTAAEPDGSPVKEPPGL